MGIRERLWDLALFFAALGLAAVGYVNLGTAPFWFTLAGLCVAGIVIREARTRRAIDRLNRLGKRSEEKPPATPQADALATHRIERAELGRLRDEARRHVTLWESMSLDDLAQAGAEKWLDTWTYEIRKALAPDAPGLARFNDPIDDAVSGKDWRHRPLTILTIRLARLEAIAGDEYWEGRTLEAITPAPDGEAMREALTGQRGGGTLPVRALSARSATKASASQEGVPPELLARAILESVRGQLRTALRGRGVWREFFSGLTRYDRAARYVASLRGRPEYTFLPEEVRGLMRSVIAASAKRGPGHDYQLGLGLAIDALILHLDDALRSPQRSNSPEISSGDQT